MSFAAALRAARPSYCLPIDQSQSLRRFVCREDAPAYHSVSTSSDYPVEKSLRQADGLALSLRAALDRIAIPLARSAAAFVQRQAWSDFGFARLADHACERFGRSGRWVKDCAALDAALQALPLLADALTGADGRRPIGRVAALLIARIASADSLAAWLALARRVPIRALREAIRAARAAGSDRPADIEAAPAGDTERSAASSDLPTSSSENLLHDGFDDFSDRALVSLPVPAPLLAAFDEVVDLYRCVEGREASVTSFVEALVGEACSAGLPPDADSRSMKVSPDPAVVETALAHSTDNWSHLPASSPASWSLALAGLSLARLREVESVAGTGGPAELDGQIRALVSLEEDLHNRLAKVLADMAERGAWPRLRFAGVGHYAEERLGVSRTSAEDRVRAVRSLRQFPHLRAACEAGRIGFEASLLIVRILGRGPVPADLERAWVARAEEATVKRLRDEVRALARTRSERAAELAASAQAAGQSSSAHPAPAPPAPLDDAAWHASLRRVPGTARDRVQRFGIQAAERPSPDVFLRLRLPHELAGDFLGVVEAARQRLSALADAVPWEEPWPDPHAAPSMLAARTFSVRSRRVPGWVGLLALLEDFVLTWDPVRCGASPAAPKRHGDPVYSRAGWRCTAPGCTSRKNLDDHHLVYRSRRGPDSLDNRTCPCRFHHYQGEHGELASCRGKAPLGILWRLGRKDLAVWYRNERRVGASNRDIKEDDRDHHRLLLGAEGQDEAGEGTGEQQVRTVRPVGAVAGRQGEQDGQKAEESGQDLRAAPYVQHRLRLQRVQQEEGGPPQGSADGGAGGAPQEQVQDRAAGEVQEESGQPEAARPVSPRSPSTRSEAKKTGRDWSGE